MNVASKSYAELKLYYDNVLNKQLMKSGNLNDVPTPIGCIEEILSRLPPSVWANPNLTVLDPCCGNGNWHLVVWHLITQHCRNDAGLETLGARFFFNDVNPSCLTNVDEVFAPAKCNVSCRDYLSAPSTDRYDLIMANPPYAHLMQDGKRSAKNHNLIGVFLEKALSQLSDCGYLVFLVPDSWMSLSDRNIKYVEMITTQCTFVHLNVHLARKWFPKVGSTFTWFVAQKKGRTMIPTNPPFLAEGVHMGFKFNSQCTIPANKSMMFLPLLLTADVLSIIEKTLGNTVLSQFQIETSSDLHRHTKKHFFSDVYDRDHPYKVIHTFRKIVYSSRPHKFQAGYKVFISLTNHYATLVEKDCGMTQSVAFVRCENLASAQRVKALLDHDLYVFLNNICRWGNFNNIRILQRFPVPPPSCQNETNLYTCFGIDDKEKACIDAFLQAARNQNKKDKHALEEQNTTT